MKKKLQKINGLAQLQRKQFSREINIKVNSKIRAELSVLSGIIQGIYINAGIEKLCLVEIIIPDHPTIFSIHLGETLIRHDVYDKIVTQWA